MKIANPAIFIGVLICGLISDCVPLHAQSSTASIKLEGDDKPWNHGVPIASREAARDLFLEGNRLFNIPLYKRAAEKYIAALEKWRHPAFYFNLALAQLNLDQQVEARNNLEQAVKDGEEPLGPERFKEAQKQLQELAHQLGRIRITCSTAGAEVTLDGATLFTGPGSHEEWIKATTHEITAKQPDYVTLAKRVTISPGELQDIELKLITLSEATDTSRRWRTWKPWAVVAAGAIVSAASGVIHALSARNFSTYDDQFLTLPCASMRGCMDDDIRPDMKSRLALARREQQIAIGGYVLGGSLIATGAVLLYMNRPRLAEQGAGRASTTSFVVAPTISPVALGISVTLSQ